MTLAVDSLGKSRFFFFLSLSGEIPVLHTYMFWSIPAPVWFGWLLVETIATIPACASECNC